VALYCRTDPKCTQLWCLRWLSGDRLSEAATANVIALIALGVSIISLLRDWIWRRLRPGTIDIFESGTINSSFGLAGAAVVLQGTLNAVDRDWFVRQIQVTVIRLRDHARHEFDWGWMPPATVTSAPSGPQGEAPAAFLLLTRQAHRYNILFFDRDTQREVNQLVQPMRESFREFWAEHRDKGESPEQLFDRFTDGNPAVLDVFGRLDRVVYWDAGRYLITMSVRTARPEKRFARSWEFELSASDSELLHGNRLSILRDAVGLQSIYSWAYCPPVQPTDAT
jgi:hypothetical protein